ncbi:hypothetical protein LP419_17915 [Massilia sp. H-1]|nr:hypothetical protein LP419_17915 [Massilia sp. H-1]
MVLLGQVELTLENPDALSQPVNLSGSLSQWQVSAAELLLLRPERLAWPGRAAQHAGAVRRGQAVLDHAAAGARGAGGRRAWPHAAVAGGHGLAHGAGQAARHL